MMISFLAMGKIHSLIGNRFYTQEKTSKPNSVHAAKNHNRKRFSLTIMDNIVGAEMPLSIPPYFEWQMIYNQIFRCACKTRWYTNYHDSLETVKTDLNRNLDILTLLRRLKMHGLALSVLLDKPS